MIKFKKTDIIFQCLNQVWWNRNKCWVKLLRIISYMMLSENIICRIVIHIRICCNCYIMLYLLLVAIIAFTPYIGILSSPTRNLTSQRSGIDIMYFKCPHKALVFWKFILSPVWFFGLLLISGTSRSKSVAWLLTSLSEAESYPEDAPNRKKLI